MFDYGMKCTWCAFTNIPIYFSISAKIGPKFKRNYTFSFQETELLLITQGKDGKFGIHVDLVDAILNTLRTIEMSNASQLLTCSFT